MTKNIVYYSAIGVVFLCAFAACDFSNLLQQEKDSIWDYTSIRTLANSQRTVRLPNSFFASSLADIGQTVYPLNSDSAGVATLKNILIELSSGDSYPDLFVDTTQFYSLVYIVDLRWMELDPTVGAIINGQLQPMFDAQKRANPNLEVKRISNIFKQNDEASLLKYKFSLVDDSVLDYVYEYRSMYLYTNASNTYLIFESTLRDQMDIEDYLWSFD
ncbi:MAG: hypothetical protein AAFP08_14625 [Bacteroidota bacterium]